MYTEIIPIGAFVELLPGKEGMVHISKFSKERVEKMEDVVKVGDELLVKVLNIDEKHRVNLIHRGVTEEDLQKFEASKEL